MNHRMHVIWSWCLAIIMGLQKSNPARFNELQKCHAHWSLGHKRRTHTGRLPLKTELTYEPTLWVNPRNTFERSPWLILTLIPIILSASRIYLVSPWSFFTTEQRRRIFLPYPCWTHCLVRLVLVINPCLISYTNVFERLGVGSPLFAVRLALFGSSAWTKQCK